MDVTFFGIPEEIWWRVEVIKTLSFMCGVVIGVVAANASPTRKMLRRAAYLLFLAGCGALVGYALRFLMGMSCQQ